MTALRLGSLFDGIGVFPLAAVRCGIEPVWASEIENAPISITKRHFPDMAHLGDVTKLDGRDLPPVHTGSGRRRKRQLDPMPPQFSCVPLRSTSENCAVLPCFSDFGYFPTAHFLTFPDFPALRYGGFAATRGCTPCAASRLSLHTHKNSTPAVGVCTIFSGFIILSGR